MHADCSDVDEFVDMLRPFAPGEIVVGEIGPVIGTHGGRGTIGVAFQVTGLTDSSTGTDRQCRPARRAIAPTALVRSLP